MARLLRPEVAQVFDRQQGILQVLCQRDRGSEEEGRQMPASEAAEPPGTIELGLEEALELLAALEDGRDVLIETDHLAVLAQIEYQIQSLSRKLGLGEGGNREA
jgi:hypothetical protein